MLSGGKKPLTPASSATKYRPVLHLLSIVAAVVALSGFVAYGPSPVATDTVSALMAQVLILSTFTLDQTLSRHITRSNYEPAQPNLRKH